jgi:hypothetical protein
MIKVKTGRDGYPIYIIGLSAENIKRLQDGHPIHFQASDIGAGAGEFLIMAGQDEATLAGELEDAGMLPPGSADQARAAAAKPRPRN